ncbi:MAG: hypothetical protein AABY14_03625 [Nanoarchaeota archaeon]
MSITNKNVTANFFSVIIDVLSKNTSKNYSLLVITNMKKTLSGEHRVLEYVDFQNGKVRIGDKINGVQNKKLGGLFIKIIDLLGPNLLKVMIKDELDPETVKYLEKLGVRFLNEI